jgi:hypothetical protein
MELKAFLYSAAAACLLAGAAQAGPPLICHPFEIGNESSLAWGKGEGWNTPQPNYDIRKLSSDTLGLLTPEKPVLVRMETLRRAAVYASRDPQAGLELAMQLMARALDSETLARFDAGYFIESMKQAGLIEKRAYFAGVNGYEWMRSSPSPAVEKPSIEFALALVKSMTTWPNEHYRAAVSGAREGSLLERNLLRQGGKRSLAELRASLDRRAQAPR